MIKFDVYTKSQTIFKSTNYKIKKLLYYIQTFQIKTTRYPTEALGADRQLPLRQPRRRVPRVQSPQKHDGRPQPLVRPPRPRLLAARPRIVPARAPLERKRPLSFIWSRAPVLDREEEVRGAEDRDEGDPRVFGEDPEEL